MLYLQGVLPQHSPSSDFGENQLSRGLISLSLLLSSHLRIFQHPRVRSFTECYLSFNLLKSRSPPLRVYCPRLGRAVGTRFPFASAAERLRLATDNNSQTHYAKGKQSPAPFYGRYRSYTTYRSYRSYTGPRMEPAPTHCRHMVAGTISLRSQRFFSPFPRGTSSLSVAKEYLALSGGPDRFMQSFTCTALLGIPLGGFEFSRTRLSRSMAQLSRRLR